MADQSFTIHDHRTDKSYTTPLFKGAVRAMDLREIKTGPGDFGTMTYDPAFMNTASCQSAITFIDGDHGILRYRGYPIEQLAEQCSFLEVAYLLLEGELPTEAQLKSFEAEVMDQAEVHENLKKLMEAFYYDAHPMGILIAGFAALATLHPDSKQVLDAQIRRTHTMSLIGKAPTVAAYAYRHLLGLPYVPPASELGYTGNFMHMLWRRCEHRFTPNAVLAKALDVLFILHADHEQNCGTSAMRTVGSSQADPYVSVAAAAAALSGPLHGGANEEVLKMLDEIGDKKNIPAFIEQVKEGKGKLMGFGHRVYKNYDPRARIIKKTAEEVFSVTARNPKLDIAIELEKIALNDEYFIKRKLYPNVDFYSGIIYQAMGFRPEMFTVLFAIPRVVGWLAQWQELIQDPEQKISRPRQIYTGQDERDVIPMGKRTGKTAASA